MAHAGLLGGDVAAKRSRSPFTCLRIAIFAWVVLLVCVLLWAHVWFSQSLGAPPTAESRNLRSGQGGDSPPVGAGSGLTAVASQLEAVPPVSHEVVVPHHRQCAPGQAWRPEPLEDNSERPEPTEGEYEERSQIWHVLPGADSQHHHGLLGRWPNGTCCRIMPTQLPSGGLSSDETREAHRGFCFNSRRSASIDVDRIQQDWRSPGCKVRHEHYPCDLPKASIVMVFHNEHFHTLVRSIHSVLNQSPAELIEELVVVDDASVADPGRFSREHWLRLQSELSDYCQTLPKVRLVRLKKRRGLMLARMEGAWRAVADMLVFLDSHIEATPGWLEPLLARIVEDRHRVVVPSIDGVNNENLEYGLGGLGVLSFTWTLGQDPVARPETDDAWNSSVMAGGLFAGDRQYFLYLGGYDPEMRLYGGEEMEIGFRTWQCGGSIEHIPCSHVGHIFRTDQFWQGQVYKVPMEEVVRNKLRAADVWMDDYKGLVHMFSMSLPPGMSVEPLAPRIALREKLQCRSFQWFLDNVAHEVKVPRSPSTRSGSMLNIGTNGCVDTLGHDEVGAEVGVYPCHGQHGTQEIRYDDDALHIIVHGGRCLGVESKHRAVALTCDSQDRAQTWILQPADGGLKGMFKIKNEGASVCLGAEMHETGLSPIRMWVSFCHENAQQLWGWYV